MLLCHSSTANCLSLPRQMESFTLQSITGCFSHPKRIQAHQVSLKLPRPLKLRIRARYAGQDSLTASAMFAHPKPSQRVADPRPCSTAERMADSLSGLRQGTGETTSPARRAEALLRNPWCLYCMSLFCCLSDAQESMLHVFCCSLALLPLKNCVNQQATEHANAYKPSVTSQTWLFFMPQPPVAMATTIAIVWASRGGLGDVGKLAAMHATRLMSRQGLWMRLSW